MKSTNPTENAAYRDADAPSKPRWARLAASAHRVAFAAAVASLALLAIVCTTCMTSLSTRANEGVYYACVAGVAVIAALSVGALWKGIGALRATPHEMLNAPESLTARRAITTSLVAMFFSFVGLAIAWLDTQTFNRGRQLRRWGRVLLPSLGANAEWAGEACEPEVPSALRGALAAQWRENGRTEHASVAAFARLTLDLMALGAPPALIAAAQRDALDEIRHAELCFSLARGLDGRAEGPTGFPEVAGARALPSSRGLALAALAVDSLVDGALHEGLSARVIAKLARRCEDAATQAVLKELAADEGRHAAHGWEVVLWCLAQGGAPVANALLGALEGLPEAMRSPLPEGAAEGHWERWGIHGHALEREEYARALSDLRVRVRRATEVQYARAGH